MEGSKIKLLAVLIAIILVAVAIVGIFMFLGDEDQLVSIKIDGNPQLIKTAERYDWKGAGTIDDPFLIESITLNVSGRAPCISISNTSLYITIKDCVLLHDPADPNSTLGPGVILNNVAHVTMVGNQVRSGGPGFTAVSSTDMHILNNTFSGTYTNKLISSWGNEFKNNQFSAIFGLGLEVQSCTSNSFSNNSFEGKPLGAGGTQGWTGLVLIGSSNNTFFGDTMSGGGYGGIGISMINSNYNTIAQAEVSGRTGLYMANANHNQILNNQFDDVVTAIDMIDSDQNVMVGNVLESNYSVTGIMMISSDENQFFWNELGIHSSTGYVAYLNDSEGNEIVNNSFMYLGTEVRALKLALDDTDLNLWNDAMVGNHWSDWISPDQNADGIVEAPYFLEGGAGAVDMLPLVAPVIIPDP